MDLPDVNRILRDLIFQIPKGKVTTFKTLALALGSPYATRFVAQAIKHSDIPWWRVVNEKGEIKNLEQLIRLKCEGVEIVNGKVNLKKHLFNDFRIGEKPLEKLRKMQVELSKRLKLQDDFSKLELIGGVDLSYKNNKAKVVYVLLDNELNLVEYYVFEERVTFPYIPTFLAFREGEPILKTFNKIKAPDILFVNGQGVAHPVKLGLASYVGVLLDIPTIGVTRKHLYGKIQGNRIFDENNQLIGYVLEKYGNVIYVSPGHKVSVETAKELSDEFWIKGRYPEPIRIADEISKKVKKE